MMIYDDIIKKMINEKYYDEIDLRMNKNYNILLSNNDYKEFLTFKENYISNNKIELPLKAFNSKKVFFYISNELDSNIKLYETSLFDMIDFSNTKRYDELYLILVCSEIEGTLNTEGVNTTRKQIQEVLNTNNQQVDNYRIIKNMNDGLKFVLSKPNFNKENLKKLYEILSDGCLNEEDVLHDKYYRDSMVEVDNNRGCDVESIDECMNSLFSYINNDSYNNFLKPLIAHYYLIYIHPYFDYNGRTARMVSVWISVLYGYFSPVYLSEAINDDKSNYYKAINKTRHSHNDLSYFLIYLTELANNYYLMYKNLKEIIEKFEFNGYSLSQSDIYYYKKIIINRKKGWFNYKAFCIFSNSEMTKQGALKILNYLTNLNLLEAKINKSKEKIFRLREDILIYNNQ